MAKTLKNYPVTGGMNERGTRIDTPFKYLNNLQRVKNSLRPRPPFTTLGQGPSNWLIWETLEIEENFYEVFVTTARELYVFKNGANMLQSSVWNWTGGPIKASILGNVIALWDPAQVVSMSTPAVNPYPNEGFIIVKSPVDYMTKVVIQSPQGTITVSIGDPTVDGYAKTDAARAVESVAKKIAQGFGGGWKNVGEVGQTALDNAKAAFDELPNTYSKNQPAWDALQLAIDNFNTADAAVQGILTPEQQTMIHDYWTDLVPSVLAEMAAINVSTVPGYVSGTDYTIQANIDTLGASTQKTQLTALRAKADGYLAKAAAALVPVDSVAVNQARNNASNALVAVMTLYGNIYWALTSDPTDLNKSFTEVMLWQAYTAINVAAAGTSTTGRYLYKGNVVYIPDTTGISITTGEEYLTLISGSVLGPADLPRYAPIGTFLKVNPVPSTTIMTSGAVCYLKAVPLLSSPVTGMSEVTWEECCLNTEPKDLIASTMPVIVDLLPSVHAWNTPADTYNYWVPRKAGDYKLCPQPLLIGNKITDVGRGANRLLLLSDNSTITSSELGRRANIFRVSALQLYPTDAISTAISGERPSHLYKIVPWGMHIALLGTSSIFKFDVSQGIDATLIKISRACSWNGPQAKACVTDADLLLISQVGVHLLSYGVYGTRTELESLTEHIDLPEGILDAFYDPLRKTIYILYPTKILVGWNLGKTWGWGWYTSPETLIKGWLLTGRLRMLAHGTTAPTQDLIWLPLEAREMNENLQNSATPVSPPVTWVLNQWAGTATYVPSPTGTALANATFYVGYATEPPPGLYLAIEFSIMTTVYNTLLVETTSAVNLIEVNAEGFFVIESTVTDKACVLGQYYDFWVEDNEVTTGVTYYLKENGVYHIIKEGPNRSVTRHNLEFNTPWGHDQTTERIDFVRLYQKTLGPAVTHIGQSLILEMPIHTDPVLLPSPYTVQDTLKTYFPWNLVNGTTFSYGTSVGATQVPATTTLIPVYGQFEILGADSLNMGWVRLAGVTFTTREDTLLTYQGAQYTNTTTHSVHNPNAASPESIHIPWSNLVGRDTSESLITLNYGEVNLCSISYYSRSTNTAPGG